MTSQPTDAPVPATPPESLNVPIGEATRSSPLPRYGIRKCKGHWHVTAEELDLASSDPNDPQWIEEQYATSDAALAVADKLNRGENIPRPAATPPEGGANPDIATELLRCAREITGYLRAGDLHVSVPAVLLERAATEVARLREENEGLRRESEIVEIARQAMRDGLAKANAELERLRSSVVVDPTPRAWMLCGNRDEMYSIHYSVRDGEAALEYINGATYPGGREYHPFTLHALHAAVPLPAPTTEPA